MKSITAKLFRPEILKKIVMPGILVLLIVFFSTQSKSFFTLTNFRNILSQCSYTVILGIGITFVMVSGSIDLSVGYVMSLVGVVIGQLIINFQMNEVAAVLIGLALGMFLGFINGVLVVKLNVFPLIVTLATSTVFQGVSYIISKSVTIFGFSKGFLFIGQGMVGGVPFSVLLAVFLVIFSTFIMKKTYFGRFIYAIGANEEAAHLAGVNVERYRILLFTICGLFVAMGTVVLISRSGTSASSIGPGSEFTCLTGGIIGGISFRGGEGSPLGMVLGILLLTVLSNGMQMMKLGTYPQYIAEGIVLIIAVGLDSYQKNRRRKVIFSDADKPTAKGKQATAEANS